MDFCDHILDLLTQEKFPTRTRRRWSILFELAEREKKKVDVATSRLLRKNKTKKEVSSELAYKTPELIEILLSCHDFDNTETYLQTITRTLGVTSERSPKFHCEMAGEGIEYDWSFCNSKYRCRPLTEKRGRQSFQQLVKEIISWLSVTKEQSRRSSARAKSFISGYFNINFENGTLMNKGTRVLTDGVVVGGVLQCRPYSLGILLSRRGYLHGYDQKNKEIIAIPSCGELI